MAKIVKAPSPTPHRVILSKCWSCRHLCKFTLLDIKQEYGSDVVFCVKCGKSRSVKRRNFVKDGYRVWKAEKEGRAFSYLHHQPRDEEALAKFADEADAAAVRIEKTHPWLFGEVR